MNLTDKPRCAYCGKRQQRIDQPMIAFPLLAGTCRDAGVKLKALSDVFHPDCARRAYAQVMDSRFARPANRHCEEV